MTNLHDDGQHRENPVSLARPNDIWDFWKLPLELRNLFSIRDQWTFIGDPKVRPAALGSVERPKTLVRLGDRPICWFVTSSQQSPGPGWVPLLHAEHDPALVMLWSNERGDAFLFPFDAQLAVEDCLTERYRAADAKAPLLQFAHKMYYRVRWIVPRQVQMRMKRAYKEVQAKLEFPAWPADDSLEHLRELLLWCIGRAARREALTRIAFWPASHSFCAVITHDVEQAAGVANIPALLEIEDRVGVRSCWNFVPERYPFDRNLLRELQAAGHEIGVHGLTHDGRLFESLKTFRRRAPRINAYAADWGAVGFRSPACHRNPEWMGADWLSADYDSSFPDTDPYQPMPGGCLSYFPWFMGNKVELPVTLPQDHVIFDVLGHSSADMWRNKTATIAKRGGMANLIVHPDYVVEKSRLREYESYLKFLREETDAWIALPRDVARWWRGRSQCQLSASRGSSKATITSGDLLAGMAWKPCLEEMQIGAQPGQIGSAAERLHADRA